MGQKKNAPNRTCDRSFINFMVLFGKIGDLFGFYIVLFDVTEFMININVHHYCAHTLCILMAAIDVQHKILQYYTIS